MSMTSIQSQNDDIPGHEFRIADLREREARIRRAFLPEDIEPDTPEYWQYLRSQTKSERMADSLKMTKMFFDEAREEIKTEHPDWSERGQRIEFVARIYGPTLAKHFRRDLERKNLYGDSH